MYIFSLIQVLFVIYFISLTIFKAFHFPSSLKGVIFYMQLKICHVFNLFLQNIERKVICDAEFQRTKKYNSKMSYLNQRLFIKECVRKKSSSYEILNLIKILKKNSLHFPENWTTFCSQK